MEGNLLLKLRENFEDKFRYDEAGVPRIWKPTDDMDGLFQQARSSTLTLIPLLSKIRNSQTGSPPPLVDWIGSAPASATAADEEDLAPIGGVDEEEGTSLEEETTLLSEPKRQDLTVRFKKAAEGVFMEAKRSTVSGIQSVPLYFYVILLALGWNEIVAGKCISSRVTRSYVLTSNSPPQPGLLHIPSPAWRRSLCHLDTQSMGSHTEHD